MAAPATDGQFPFGDICAVGFAIWTIWDIYDLVDILPREIGNSLYATVDEIQSQTISAISDAARRTLEANCQAAHTIAATAVLKQ